MKQRLRVLSRAGMIAAGRGVYNRAGTLAAGYGVRNRAGMILAGHGVLNRAGLRARAIMEYTERDDQPTEHSAIYRDPVEGTYYHRDVENLGWVPFADGAGGEGSVQLAVINSVSANAFTAIDEITGLPITVFKPYTHRVDILSALPQYQNVTAETRESNEVPEYSGRWVKEYLYPYFESGETIAYAEVTDSEDETFNVDLNQAGRCWNMYNPIYVLGSGDSAVTYQIGIDEGDPDINLSHFES